MLAADPILGYVHELPLGFLPLSGVHPILGSARPAGTAPVDVAVDPTDGTAFVAETGTSKIAKYDGAGALLGLLDDGLNPLDPHGLAIDSVGGVLFVADWAGNRVLSFDASSGARLQTLAGLDHPSGMAVDPVNHVLYVTEKLADKVSRFAYTPAPSCSPVPSVSAQPTVRVSLTCSDGAGEPITYAIASEPAHGDLSGLHPATGAVTYTRDAGYQGADSFGLVVKSVNGTGATATVSVAAIPAPPPVCAPQTLSTRYEVALPLALACTVSGGPVARYRIVKPPASGLLSEPNADGCRDLLA